MRKNAFLEETQKPNYAGSSTDSYLPSLKPPPSLMAMKEACSDKHTPPAVGIQTVPCNFILEFYVFFWEVQMWHVDSAEGLVMYQFLCACMCVCVGWGVGVLP